MSGVDFLDKLLDGVTVEWRPLGSFAEIYGGLTGKNKADFDGGNAKYVSYKNIFANLNVDLSSLESVKVSSSENQHQGKYGDVLFTGSSEIADEAGMSSAVTTQFEESVFLNSFSFGVRFNKGIPISPEFSKYLFRTSFMRSEIAKTASGVTRFNVSKERFRKILVPILCPENPKKSLEIQAEIVRILDAMTELNNELNNELTVRKKQYKHYRDQLLSFEDGAVQLKTLGEVMAMRAGQHISASKISDIANDGFIYPCFGGNGVRGYVKEKSHSGEYLLVGRQGALCGNVQRMKGDFYATEHAVVVTVSEDVNVDWAFHMLTLMNLNQYASQSAQPGLAVGKLEGLKIPVPALVEQIRIATILDKFDALTSSLTEGLPREIELRQKQYAHYRDLLLSFPKPQEVVA